VNISLSLHIASYTFAFRYTTVHVKSRRVPA